MICQTFELLYTRYLQFLKENGEIKSWEYEVKTFWFEKVLRGVRSYLPDFLVLNNDGSESYHEVKGWFDDRSKTKLKRMKKYYPDVEVIVIASVEYKEIKQKLSRMIHEWE